MKRVTLDANLIEKLKAAVGQDAPLDQYVVFEATAFNTGPVRQKHPLYKGAMYTQDVLSQMASQLAAESLPLQIMHKGQELPVGRVFYAEPIGNELRALFWVEAKHTDLVSSIDNGTVDQVSVNIMTKDALCSKCGFNFFGATSTYDNVWSGTCDQGHTVGEDGTHVLGTQLDTWGELSLVNRGGLTGARIHGKADRRLVADDGGPSPLSLFLILDNTESSEMDLTTFMAQLTAKTDEAALAKAQQALLETQLADAKAQIDALTAQLAAGPKEITVEVPDTAAVIALSDFVGKLAAKTGDVTSTYSAETPVAELQAAGEAAVGKLALQQVRLEAVRLSSEDTQATQAFRRNK